MNWKNLLLEQNWHTKKLKMLLYSFDDACICDPKVATSELAATRTAVFKKNKKSEQSFHESAESRETVVEGLITLLFIVQYGNKTYRHCWCCRKQATDVESALSLVVLLLSRHRGTFSCLGLAFYFISFLFFFTQSTWSGDNRSLLSNLISIDWPLTAVDFLHSSVCDGIWMWTNCQTKNPSIIGYETEEAGREGGRQAGREVHCNPLFKKALHL